MSQKENIKPRKRIVFAVRDFPNNCGPVKAWCFEASDNSKGSEVKPETKVEDEGEQMESKAVPPPWKRISATRTFPPGCNTKTLQKKGKMHKKDKPNKSKNSSEGVIPVSTHREIVQALRATGERALMTAEKSQN